MGVVDMLRKSARKPVLILLGSLLIILVAVGGFVLGSRLACNGCHEKAEELAFLERYRGVNCIPCFRQTNYLINSGQDPWSSPDDDLKSETQIVSWGDTFEEIASYFRSRSPWQCDSCLYRNVEHIWAIQNSPLE